MNTASVSIQREGEGVNTMFAKVRIHISEMIPQIYFPVFVRVQIQAPHAFRTKPRVPLR